VSMREPFWHVGAIRMLSALLYMIVFRAQGDI
jgi:hypothetical protein